MAQASSLTRPEARKARRTRVIWSLSAITLIITLAWLQISINRETTAGPEALNAAGTTGSALIVYHPGLSDLQEALTSAFARGLIEQGWRVERVTTSKAAPTDLSGYDLLVLGVHTYWWAPDGPTVRYLRRLNDLNGKPTVALLSALGATGRSERLTRARIEVAHGKVIEVLPLWVLRPNDETDSRPNREVALDKAYQAARRVAESMK